MKILILTQYYPPEVGAPQNRLSDFARRFVQFGHKVTVLTAMPNYPKGEVFEGYRGRLVVEEQRENVRVIRAWIYATKKHQFSHRILHYSSFAISATLVGVIRVGRQDVIVVESPPLFLGVAGILLSWISRAQLVFNVSDLWPESAVALGVLRNGFLTGAATWLEGFIYRCSRLITGQTKGIIENIRARFPRKRVELVANGVDVGTFLSQPLLKEEIQKTAKKKMALAESI